MIKQYLDKSIEDLETLIKITQKDIKDIKEAKHEQIFGRIDEKEKLLNSFGKTKTLLDRELVSLTKKSANKPLDELLNKEQKDSLGIMKNKLVELKETNKKYAKLAVVINEFYNSLMDSIFPREMDKYKKTIHKRASLIALEA